MVIQIIFKKPEFTISKKKLKMPLLLYLDYHKYASDLNDDFYFGSTSTVLPITCSSIVSLIVQVLLI